MTDSSWWYCPSCGGKTIIKENKRWCRDCTWSYTIPIHAGNND